MANFTPSIIGQANAAGDDRALALQLFAGEVLTAYNEIQVVEGKYMKKTVSQGKSFSWPETWKALAEQHAAGEEINGQVINHGERVITIDSLDIAPVFLDDLDQAIMHYDARSILSRQLGIALGNLNEGNVLRSMLIAARSTPSGNELDPGSNEKDGNVLTSTGLFGSAGQFSVASSATNRANLISAMYSTAQQLDERDIPDNGDRNVFLTPASYYLAISAGTDIVNRDFGGNGSVQMADLRYIANMPIFKSNIFRQIAGVDETDPGSIPAGVIAKYRADNSDTVAVVSTKESVGMVDIIGVQAQAEYSVRHQGWLLVARKANGLGTLRPEAAVEISDA